MTSNDKKYSRKYVLFMIGCVVAIVGGIGLLSYSARPNSNETSLRTDNEAPTTDVPPPQVPEQPEDPITFNDPQSEVIPVTITADGFRRRFNIFIPGAYFRSNEDVPLVYVWHGFTQTPEVIQQEYGMDVVAESENFLIVYPGGIGNNWNVYDIEDNRDLVFAAEILNYMKANYRVREESVYSTGYSLGGFMSNLMACVYSNDFAAVAPLAGTFATGVMEDCKPQRTVPYLQIHGTRDFVIPLGGSGQWESVDDTLAFWADNNGQQSNPIVSTVSSGVDLYDFQPDSIVQHYRLIGVSHGQTVPTFPKQTIIDFFKRVSNFNRDAPVVKPEQFLPVPFQDAQSEVVPVTITADGFSRRFNIFVPGSYVRSNEAVPLVYVWHGFTQSPEVIQEDYGMDSIAENENFLIVYPAGILNNWNVYDVEDNRDLVFAAEILNYMKANYRIKEGSVYSTGYSLGGFMSNLMACVFSTDFAAVAPLAGTFARGVMENCKPQRTVPYLQIHGTVDFVIPLGGNFQWDSVDDALAFWANNNGQQSTPQISEVASGVELYDFKPDSIVQHYRLYGVTHGQTVPSFNKQMIIDFFKRVTDF